MTSQSQTLSSTHLNAADLAEFDAAVREQRRFRISQLAELATGGANSAAVASPDVAAALKQAAQHALGQIDRALKRLESGRYGRCLGCGRPISRTRLEVIPTAILRMACQRRADAGLPLCRAPHTVDDAPGVL